MDVRLCPPIEILTHAFSIVCSAIEYGQTGGCNKNALNLQPSSNKEIVNTLSGYAAF
jgi:hypothetical protein